MILAFSLIFCGAASATTIDVNNETGIQNAINGASDGDTLNLSEGTYNEHDILVNKNLTITGPQTSVNSPPTAIIDAQKQGGVFYINSGVKLALQNLLITNGNTNSGGGINNNGTLTITNCTITNNTATYGRGGAIYTPQGNLTINNTQITNNTANSGGAIYNSGNLTINNTQITNNKASFGGGIYQEQGNFTINDSNITNNTATNYAGGIYTYKNNLTITNTQITNNIAFSAGGIYSKQDNLTITNTQITNNTATNSGGAIAHYEGNLNINDSNITNNTATNYAGGIYTSQSNLTITRTQITNNTATTGGAIYNYGTSTLKFCRIIGNTANQGPAIYCNAGSVDATLNWWGSNEDPIGNIFGNVTVNPWLVLNLTANPTSVLNESTSNITADLLHDNNGVYHDPEDGNVPDGIPISFATTLGTINSPVSILNGAAQSTLNTGPITGDADVSTILDGQTVHTIVKIQSSTTTPTVNVDISGGIYNTDKVISLNMSETGNIYYTTNGTTPTSASNHYIDPIIISTTTTLKFIAINTAGNPSIVHTETYIIDKIAPISSSDPKGGTYNTDKVISLTMNESGSIYYTLNGATPSTNSTKYSGPITLTSNTILKFIAVDTVGNPSTVYTETYIFDKIIPKVVSTFPKNKATKVSRTANIYIKFSENIRTSTNWSKIIVKDKKGKKVTIQKWISGNRLYIKTKKRLSNAYYTVYIPAAAIQDASGNKLSKTNYFKFKTRR